MAVNTAIDNSTAAEGHAVQAVAVYSSRFIRRRLFVFSHFGERDAMEPQPDFIVANPAGCREAWLNRRRPMKIGAKNSRQER
jgi:hypothetical protein